MSFTQSALRRFEKDVKGFSEWEGLEGHYQSVQIRWEDLDSLWVRVTKQFGISLRGYV